MIAAIEEYGPLLEAVHDSCPLARQDYGGLGAGGVQMPSKPPSGKAQGKSLEQKSRDLSHLPPFEKTHLVSLVLPHGLQLECTIDCEIPLSSLAHMEVEGYGEAYALLHSERLGQALPGLIRHFPSMKPHIPP